ncbi:MAG TPA: BON domain-containing protein [Thermoanaerobaculia bacterium]|nr:BON domain-containing protein [Thermoanaerobaculia bacterium]
MQNRSDRGEFSGPYARDPHPGLGDDYARDGGWSGGGRHDDYVRDPGDSPDARLVDAVNTLLAEHDGIDARDIKVSADNGEVTLDGIAGSRYETKLAEDVVRSCKGVREVHNRLTLSDREVQIGKASE